MPNTRWISFDRSFSGSTPQPSGLKRFTILMLILAVISVSIPMTDAIPFRLRGATLSRSITIGRAVDSVLLDGVNITNGVEVVFDISAMVPTALHIELKNCVCSDGSQIKVRGYSNEVMHAGTKLEMVISGLSGDVCSLMFASHMPANTKVIIRDSTIVATNPVSGDDDGDESKEKRSKTPRTVHAPLILDAVTLTKGQLRLENTVLRSTLTAGSAMLINGNVTLVNSALVLDGVLLEVSGTGDVHGLRVSPSSLLSLQKHSVFSVTNSSIFSSGKGIFLGNQFTLTDSILRLALVDGRVALDPVLNFGSESVISAGGWLDIHNVMATGGLTTSVASLSHVALTGGVVSIVRSAAHGTTLVKGPLVKRGKFFVQCNRANGKLLQSSAEYNAAGLSDVDIVPCESCAAELRCYAAMTSSMSNCACRCSSGGVGPACLPMDVPLAKADATDRECMSGVVITKSMTIGQGESNMCFEAVVFSGPIIVTVDLRSMNTLATTLNMTLQRCMLAGGAQLRIRGFDGSIAAMMPPVSLSVMNMTATEGTIILEGTLPKMSSVLLTDSTLSSTVNKSSYVIRSSGNTSIKYSPVLVLDNVNLVSTNFVLTRTIMRCGGSSCAVILVEHGLILEKRSAFYMDNCAVNAAGNVVKFISSELSISGESVFSIRNNSWWVKSEDAGDAWECKEIALKEGSVLEMTGNTMYVRKSIIVMTSLKVKGSSWLLQRENEFHCQYVFKVANVEVEDKNVWSVMRNKFFYPPGPMYMGANMWNQSASTEFQGLTVYGVCNYRLEELVSDYGRLSMQRTLQQGDCGTCLVSAECLAGKTLSGAVTATSTGGDGCKCKCASGGHGDLCLPVAAPKTLGPIPPPEAGTVDIPCVYDGSIDTIPPPVLGASGMCFVSVHFTSPIVIDLGEFRPTRKTINITFTRCTMSGVSVIGIKDYTVHMSMTASTITDGKFVIGGKFGPESRIQLVDSAIDTTDAEGFVMQEKTELGSGSRILLLRTNIVARMSAISFMRDFSLDASGFIVQNSRLEAALPLSTTSAALSAYSLQIKKGGYLSIVDTEMIAGSGVWLAHASVVSSAGRFVLSGNTLKGHGNVTGTALLHRNGDLTLSGGSTLRVMLNKVKGASIYQVKEEYSGSLTLSDPGTAVIFSENDMEGIVKPFHAVNTNVDSSAMLVDGCNKKNGERVKLATEFPGVTLTEFDCGSCSEGAKCYMPDKNGLMKSSLCSCSRSGKDRYRQCPSCLPYEVPEIDVMPALAKPVDRDTTCVENQTLTELSLKMQKTHHCYIGVTFSGEKAVAKFVFRRMPLQYPINITFSGCTFLGGAALHFVGSRDAVDSAGVWIRVTKTVLLSSVVSFSNALPKGSDVTVKEIDSVQVTTVKTPDDFPNEMSIVAMKGLLLSGSSILLVSDANVRYKGISRYLSGMGNGMLVGESLTLLDGSSLYVQNCSFLRFNNFLKLDGPVNIDGRSVMTLLGNRMILGKYLMHSKEVMVRNLSVFRMIENSVLGGQGVYMYSSWDLRNSSWVEWRGNNVGSRELLYLVSTAGVNIDGNSILTFIGSSEDSKGATGPLLKSKEPGYKFISGCVVLPEDASIPDSSGVTNKVGCDRCVQEGACFAPFTSSSNDCLCKCADGGHGDVCVPGRVAVPLLPPPLPSPPAPDECMSDVEYPEVSHTLGEGLSSLCYRNVTFSGAFMRLTVDVSAMVGDVNIKFDGCKWLRGAALVLLGGDKAAFTKTGSVNIVITGNTFHEALLSPFGSFPPRTNIIVSGNHFNVTRIIAAPDVKSAQRSCIATKELRLSANSAFKLMENSFVVSGEGSTVVFIGTGGMTLQSYSMFAMKGNKFTLTDGGSAVLHVLGDEVKTALEVYENSVVAIEKSHVSGVLENFVFLSVLNAESKSAFLLEDNDGLMVRNILNIKEDMHLSESWLRMQKNSAYNLSATVFRVDSTVTMKGSQLVLSGNSVSPVSDRGTAAIAALKSYITHTFDDASSVVFACNVLNGEVVESYTGIPSEARLRTLPCGESCSREVSCFLGLTSSSSAPNCACDCVNGGSGDRCLPVDVPKLTDEDPCVRDMDISWEVHAGFGQSVVCYVGVTFTADVVVNVSAMWGDVRNVTIVNCTMADSASLYVVGWVSDPPAGPRVEVWIRELVSRSGGGVLLANSYPRGSRVTVVDSMLIAETPVAYRPSYNLGDASACLVLYNVNLAGGVLTVARTQVVAVFNEARGVLVAGGVKLSSGGALYMEGMLLQTALGRCVSLEGEATMDTGSVLAFVNNDFLLCKHAVSVHNTLNVAGSAVSFVRNEFVLPSDHVVAFHSTVSFTEGSMLLMKANTHDSNENAMLYTANTMTASSSMLSFTGNEGLSPRMLSGNIVTSEGAQVRVSCNSVGGNKLTTATEYTAAGFGDAAGISVIDCDVCDKEAYCYPSGTESSAEENGECVCKCGSSGYGEVCVPVESVTLPPAPSPQSSSFTLKNTTVHSTVVVTRDVKEVTFRDLVMDGAQAVIYVPWLAKGNVRIFVQNVSLQNGAMLYVVGGSGVRRPLTVDDNQRVELTACSVGAFNGVITLAGTFPTDSVLTITNSLLITTEVTPFEYLPGTTVEQYAPALLLWNLQLVKSLLVVHEVALLSVMADGQAMIAGGSLLQLTNGGIALDAVQLGGDHSLHVFARVSLSTGAVLRLSESKVYGDSGLLFESGIFTNASVVVIGENTGLINSGALLTLQGSVSFVSDSWLSLRGNKFVGKLLSLPPQANGAQFIHSTLTLHDNAGTGSALVDGTVAPQRTGLKFVVGCMTHNGRKLTTKTDHASAGIVGSTHIVECGACDADLKCFAAGTNSMSACNCQCNNNGYGHNCLPVSVPRPVGCNSTAACPALKITTSSGRHLSQDDIRNGGTTETSEGAVRLMLTLPPPFRWVGDADEELRVKFDLGSSEQRNGFHGPWGEKLRNATWRGNASSPESVLELTIPGQADYFVGVDEMIHLQYGPSALHGGCLGDVRGSFVITSNTPEELRQALLFFTGIGVSASTLAVSAAGGLASLAEAQVLGAFTVMSCASAHERASLSVLRYFLSPFAGLGFLWMVIGNLLIIAVFGRVHYGLTRLVGYLHGIRAESAWAAMRYPNITFLVAYLLHPGIVVGSAFTLAMPEAQLYHYVIGALGMLYSVGFVAGASYFVVCRSKAKFLSYDEFAKMPLAKRWLYPVGYWYLTSQQQIYSSLFMSVRGGWRCMCLFQLTVVCIVGAMAAVQTPASKCHILYFAMATVLFAAAAVIVITNMMRSFFLTAAYTFGFVLLGLLCVTNAANTLTPSDAGLRVYSAIVMLFTLLLLALALYSVLLYWLESYRWRPLRTRPDKHPEVVGGASADAAAPAAGGDGDAEPTGDDEETGNTVPTPVEPIV